MIGALLAGGGAAGPAPTDRLLNPLASSAARERVRAQLAGLGAPVWLRVFTQSGDDERLRAAALRLAQGVADLSNQVLAEGFEQAEDAEQFRAYGIARTPALVVMGERDYGLRFYGVPGGGELESLVAAIRLASAGDSGLSEASRQALGALSEPVEVEVFATLSCQFCPEAVMLAHRLAVESEQVTSAMVDASAFPRYAEERGVRAVPAVLVNGVSWVEGGRAEEGFVAAVVSCATRGAVAE